MATNTGPGTDARIAPSRTIGAWLCLGGLWLATPAPVTAHVDMLTIGEAINDYNDIAGASHLERHCGYLNPADRARFEQNYDFITSHLGEELGSMLTLSAIQNGSKKVLKDPAFADCGDQGRAIVEHVAGEAQRWVDRLDDHY